MHSIYGTYTIYISAMDVCVCGELAAIVWSCADSICVVARAFSICCICCLFQFYSFATAGYSFCTRCECVSLFVCARVCEYGRGLDLLVGFLFVPRLGSVLYKTHNGHGERMLLIHSYFWPLLLRWYFFALSVPPIPFHPPSIYNTLHIRFVCCFFFSFVSFSIIFDS